MKFTYIKLSKNQDNAENKKEIRNNYSRGKHSLDKNFSEKNKILNVKSEERYLNKSYKEANENYKVDEKKDRIKKILSKNQVALYAISLMLITSGYFNYTNNLKMASIGDAQLVSTNLSIDEDEANYNTMENENSTNIIENEVKESNANIVENEVTDKEMSNIIDENENKISNLSTTNNIEGTVIESSNNNIKSEEYFTQTKLERDKMYSQMIETYEKILENNNISSEQKNTSSEEIKNINNKRNAIATSETLIKAKGIENIVIIVNGDVIDAIVKSKEELKTEQVAQISNIISRELGADIENIHITTHE